MFRSVLAVLILIILAQYFGPWLRRFRFGKLPGDITFYLFNRVWYLPITTAFLVSALLEVISRFI